MCLQVTLPNPDNKCTACWYKLMIFGLLTLYSLFICRQSKEKYLETVNKKFDKVIQQAVSYWKSLIEEYPDQVIWGTDRGDAVWNYDEDVGEMQVKIARAFIGKLDPAVQEKFAYRNAERLIEASGEDE